MSNATTPQGAGWDILIEGNMLEAVYTMYNMAWLGTGIIMVILFMTYQYMLYEKAQNLTLNFITGIFFISLYATSSFVDPFAFNMIFIVLLFQLAGILFVAFFMGRD